MTRKEEIEQKAHELSEIAFPYGRNIWAHPNLEAKVVNSCCISIAEWADETMLDKVCEWVKKHYIEYAHNRLGQEYIIEDLREAMKE